MGKLESEVFGSLMRCVCGIAFDRHKPESYDHRRTFTRLLKRSRMKYVGERPYADPDAAARKLIEIANSVEAAQNGRIYIELVNWPFLSTFKATSDEYRAGIKRAIGKGWIEVHESGTYLKFTQAGADLFA